MRDTKILDYGSSGLRHGVDVRTIVTGRFPDAIIYFVNVSCQSLLTDDMSSPLAAY